MSEMIVQVRNKILRRIGGVNHFVSHNKDYTIQFQFDESWDNVRTKMAVFAYEDGEYGSEIFDGDTCNVPEFPREGRILIGVKAGEDLSTELLCIPVCKSADDVITDEYDEPDPKIYEQILDIINNLWNGGTTVYPSPVKFLASPSAAKVGDLIRVKEVDENGDVTRTEGFDVGVELEKKIDAPQTAQVGEVLTVEEVGEDGKPKKWKTAPGVNITTELTQESTDSQVPSAKAAYDAIQNATDKDAVRFVAQELTEEQKEQARKNINATPKLYYWPKEKIASAVVSEYQTSDHKWRKRCEYNNVLLSLPADRNIFLCGDNEVTIIKTETDGQIQFNINATDSIKVEKAEFQNYFGYLYFVTMVLTAEIAYSSQLQNLYASAMGMTIDPVLIGMANSDGKPGLIKTRAQEYNSIVYNPLVLDKNGYGMSYNEFSITTASDVGWIFRTRKAKAILVTDEIPVFLKAGFDPPYFMTQLSTNFYDGEITNNYMVMSPFGMFFARGEMNVRGTSNTVFWTYDSSQLSMSLPLIEEFFAIFSANTLRSPTTAQVGQIVKVKAVDADGKITETEAVDGVPDITVKKDAWIDMASPYNFVEGQTYNLEYYSAGGGYASAELVAKNCNSLGKVGIFLDDELDTPQYNRIYIVSGEDPVVNSSWATNMQARFIGVKEKQSKNYVPVSAIYGLDEYLGKWELIVDDTISSDVKVYNKNFEALKTLFVQANIKGTSQNTADGYLSFRLNNSIALDTPEKIAVDSISKSYTINAYAVDMLSGRFWISSLGGVPVRMDCVNTNERITNIQFSVGYSNDASSQIDLFLGAESTIKIYGIKA